MKRTYIVNFDFLDSRGKLQYFSRTYTLNEKYADNFFNTLRKELPNMNIYVPFSHPAEV